MFNYICCIKYVYNVQLKVVLIYTEAEVEENL